MADLQTAFKNKRFMADNLPTLPVALQEAQRLANDPKTTVAQLAEIIGRDQALSGKVLKMVNSATYGFPGRIASVQNALVLLGFNIVKSLLLSAMVFESASKGMSELWRHSSGCAVACREIGRLLKMENTDECFIAGLLHDIGQVVTAVQLPEAHAEIAHIAREEDILLHEAEERILGMAHPHVGAWLVSQWNLPVSLRQAIAYHHRPAKAQDPITLACIVHVGDFLACLFECGDNGNPHVPVLDPHAFKHLELSRERLGMAVDAVGEIFEQGRIL